MPDRRRARGWLLVMGVRLMVRWLKARAGRFSPQHRRVPSLQRRPMRPNDSAAFLASRYLKFAWHAFCLAFLTATFPRCTPASHFSQGPTIRHPRSATLPGRFLPGSSLQRPQCLNRRYTKLSLDNNSNLPYAQSTLTLTGEIDMSLFRVSAIWALFPVVLAAQSTTQSIEAWYRIPQRR